MLQEILSPAALAMPKFFVDKPDTRLLGLTEKLLDI